MNLKNVTLWLGCLLTVVLLAGCPKPTYPNCKEDADCNVTVMGEDHTGVCMFGKCQECSKDEDCKDGKMCVNNACVAQCQTNSDCGAGMECLDGKCSMMPGSCKGPADCDAGYDCVDGMCTAVAMGNYDAMCGTERIAFFDFDKYSIKPEGVAMLNKIGGCLKNMPQVNVIIKGYTDKWGTEEYNLALGERRAKAAAKFLENMGIAKGRIKVVSYGKADPLDGADNAAAWSKNRRAVVVLPQ